jgi:hypothetical protein
MQATRDAMLREVIVTSVDDDEVLACEPRNCLIADMNLLTIKREELKVFKNTFQTVVTSETAAIHAFAGHFDTIFNGPVDVPAGLVVCLLFFFLSLSLFLSLFHFEILC